MWVALGFRGLGVGLGHGVATGPLLDWASLVWPGLWLLAGVVLACLCKECHSVSSTTAKGWSDALVLVFTKLLARMLARPCPARRQYAQLYNSTASSAVAAGLL
jgi:hypothetical protein